MGGYGGGAGLPNIGLRMLLDTYVNFYAPGMAVYLRYQNASVQGQDYAALGFTPTVSGAPVSGGFTDAQIFPQPVVSEVSKHDIGIMGGQLLFGAKTFQISATFVNETMKAKGYTDPFQVFRDPLLLGIIYNQRMYSIVAVEQSDVGGQPLLWDITCNMSEQPVSPSLPGEIPTPDQGG